MTFIKIYTNDGICDANYYQNLINCTILDIADYNIMLVGNSPIFKNEIFKIYIQKEDFLFFSYKNDIIFSVNDDWLTFGSVLNKPITLNEPVDIRSINLVSKTVCGCFKKIAAKTQNLTLCFKPKQITVFVKIYLILKKAINKDCGKLILQFLHKITYTKYFKFSF